MGGGENPLPGNGKRWYVTPELLEPKSIVKSILLSVVTLGIYRWFWMYSLMKRVRYLADGNSSCGMEMVCYLFVPFMSGIGLHKGEKAGRWGGRIWDCPPPGGRASIW